MGLVAWRPFQWPGHGAEAAIRPAAGDKGGNSGSDFSSFITQSSWWIQTLDDVSLRRGL